MLKKLSIIGCFLLVTFASHGEQITAQVAQCQRIKLQVLGSGGPELNDGRTSTAYLVWIDGKSRILVDAGPGASIQFGKANADIADLDAILLTHLHVDHAADLPALIKGAYFSSRTSVLPIYGPAGNSFMPSTKDYLSRLFSKKGAFTYLHDYWETDVAGDFKIQANNHALDREAIISVKLNDTITLSSIAVHHGPVAAIAWRIDVGDCSMTFSGDMSNRYDTLAKLALNTDILVAHNAIPENAGRIARSLHMPPSEIGKIAHQANVRKLVLSHRMRRTLGRETQTLATIKQHYSGKIDFADDLDVFELTESFQD